jgi:hypothetical protein
MLASRNGPDTAEMSMADVAAKLAELVTINPLLNNAVAVA